MNKTSFFLAAATALLAIACNNRSSGEITPVDTSGSNGVPVETQKPNSNYQPAFKGQTRIAGTKTVTAFKAEVLTEGLQSPWGITLLTGGKFLITQKAGTMRIVTTAGNVSAAITGLPAVNASGQGGLLGVTADPQFAGNRMVYWSFSENSAEGNVTAIAKGRLSADEKQIENATVIYRATPAYNGTLHYGGRIIFDKSGNLIISTGERSDLTTRPQAQSLTSSLGKIIRITTNGQPAEGNPFTGRSDARPELYSYGHRNVQGLAVHPETGDLWESELGPLGGDEINHIESGKNYGWPTITYGLEYSGQPVGAGIQQQQGLEQPVYYWDPVISPSGITFYKGNAVPEWHNNLFVCSLSGTHVDRLIITGNRVTGEERLLSNEGQRFRDITDGNDGALYAITDGGRLYRIGKE